MKHFVCYHNPDQMGYTVGDQPRPAFSVLTNKDVDPLLGHTVWLITGEGSPRRYSLVYRFIVDEVGPAANSGFEHSASGRRGHVFRPPIPLNDQTWFPRFRKKQGNFGLGLNSIGDEFVPHFQELARAAGYGAEMGETGAGPDEWQAVGAGFGDPETNRRVEQAAVTYVTALYERREWRVESVESENRGYDLLARKGRKERHLEVKGVRGGEVGFILTAGEKRCAETDSAWVCCVVTEALTESPGYTEIPRDRLLADYHFDPVAFRVTAKRR